MKISVINRHTIMYAKFVVKFKGRQVSIFACFCKLGIVLKVIIVEVLPIEKHRGKVSYLFERTKQEILSHKDQGI